ncbi:MAG TPA: hypothetical protein VME63_12375 [Dyella sp.]|uniref:hypothetical protein n=1 Tax=Dyella sp. TaxID=1869338 RepID=UPI002BFA5157|nr:hypothetical protein [Dyella sp.]HTV86199.1 hypothetical protein [Dyella sp.]
MDLQRLAFWLEDVTPRIENLDGYLFIDRLGLGPSGLRKKTGSYGSMSEAQLWMNIVLLDDFISEVVGDDWESNDPAVNRLLSVFEQAWSYQVRVSFPGTDFLIERLLDDEYGDLGLRLINSHQ